MLLSDYMCRATASDFFVCLGATASVACLTADACLAGCDRMPSTLRTVERSDGQTARSEEAGGESRCEPGPGVSGEEMPEAPEGVVRLGDSEANLCESGPGAAGEEVPGAPEGMVCMDEMAAQRTARLAQRTVDLPSGDPSFGCGCAARMA